MAIRSTASRLALACHNPGFTGMEPAIPGLLGLRASYISAQLGGWRYGTRTAAAPDCMQIVAGLLTEDDVKAVAAYLSSRPAPADPSFAPHGSLPMPLACGSEAELRGSADVANLEQTASRAGDVIADGRRDGGDRAAAVETGPGLGGQRRISRSCRRLHRLPHRARRQDLCRWPADGDAVRHALYVEHHARSADRDRHLDVGSILHDDA